MTPFGDVKRQQWERVPGWVQFLALSLLILLALSLRASFTLSPDTCSYNFCNSISVEEIGFTVNFISFSRELSYLVFQLNPLWILLVLHFQGIEAKCFPFLSPCYKQENFICSFSSQLEISSSFKDQIITCVSQKSMFNLNNLETLICRGSKEPQRQEIQVFQLNLLSC